MFCPFHFINKIKLHYFEAIVILHTFCPVYCVQFYASHLSSFMKKLRSLWSSLQLRNDTNQRLLFSGNREHWKHFSNTLVLGK